MTRPVVGDWIIVRDNPNPRHIGKLAKITHVAHMASLLKPYVPLVGADCDGEAIAVDNYEQACAVENSDYPGEYRCEYPAGHGPLMPDVLAADPRWGDEFEEDPPVTSYDHAAPSAGALWTEPDKVQYQCGAGSSVEGNTLPPGALPSHLLAPVFIPDRAGNAVATIAAFLGSAPRSEREQAVLEICLDVLHGENSLGVKDRTTQLTGWRG